ncbi:uncharacterized protein LOC113317415 [Papaver somniferum]|uniref:uncharacterized protein LOC113317415 n=1 Tax=Papaver somniferum TaxID=3469 RepID=UPI000E6FF916|nr:uncharacterized protein LOC113317415 [Papaver somniferum]
MWINQLQHQPLLLWLLMLANCLLLQPQMSHNRMLTQLLLMTDNYMKYWGSYEAMNPFLFIVVLLDPRQKEVGLNFRLEILCKDDLERVAELRDCVKKDLERLFNEYNLRYLVDNEATSIAQDTEMVEAGVDSLDIMEALLKGRLEKRRMESVSIEGRSEVERYLADVCENATPSLTCWVGGRTMLPSIQFCPISQGTFLLSPSLRLLLNQLLVQGSVSLTHFGALYLLGQFRP